MLYSDERAVNLALELTKVAYMQKEGLGHMVVATNSKNPQEWVWMTFNEFYEKLTSQS